MPDVHRPHLDEEEPVAAAPPERRSRSRSLARLGLEILLISAGVFLGLAGEQWREHAHRQELAQASLRRFRTEVAANRKAVAAVATYHVEMKKTIEDYLAADANARKTMSVNLQGIQPASFSHTAWDLALATQSMADIGSNLAYALSSVYGLQEDYTRQTGGLLQAMYVRPPRENLDVFLEAVDVYYGDVVLWEPKLLEQYDALLVQLDRTLGETGPIPDHAQGTER